jgi:[acyl-carrier-protein] S-malonyltransferase
MGQKLYDRYPAAQRVFERAEDVLEMPLRRLCFDGPEDELNRTEVLQPCVTTVSWAAYEIWRESYGMDSVRVMAGHSLGEFCALAAAGAYSWEEALLLVRERGRIMADAAKQRPGGMIAIVGLDEQQVERIRAEASAKGSLWFANRNSFEQFVLSGETAAIREAEQLALAAGARRALILTIPLPAHSPLMEKAGSAFAAVVGRLPLRQPEWPLLANADGAPVRSVEELRRELSQHLLRPVDWTRTMAALEKLEIRTVVELGQGRVLASLAAKHIPGVDTWNAEELFVDFVDTPPVPA